MTKILDEAIAVEEMNNSANWKARIGLFGPSKSGKTTSALTLPPYYQGKKKPRLLIDMDGRSQSAASFDDVVVLSIFDQNRKSPKAW